MFSKENDMKYISKRYQEDKSTAMGQSDVLAKAFDDVIDLSLGDPDMTTPKAIIDAAYDAMQTGHTKYTDFRGDPELRSAIINQYREDYDMDIDDEGKITGLHQYVYRFLSLSNDTTDYTEDTRNYR